MTRHELVVPERLRGGPAPRFDRQTADRRKREMTKRYAMVNAEIAHWLEDNHPKIFLKAKAHAKAAVAERRGPLPGD